MGLRPLVAQSIAFKVQSLLSRSSDPWLKTPGETSAKRGSMNRLLIFIFGFLALGTVHGQTKVVVTDGLAKILQDSRAWLKEHEEWKKDQEALKTVLDEIKKVAAEQDRASHEEIRNIKKHEGSKIKYEDFIVEHDQFRKDHAVIKLRQEALKKLTKDLEAALAKFEPVNKVDKKTK